MMLVAALEKLILVKMGPVNQSLTVTTIQETYYATQELFFIARWLLLYHAGNLQSHFHWLRDLMRLISANSQILLL